MIIHSFFLWGGEFAISRPIILLFGIQIHRCPKSLSFHKHDGILWDRFTQPSLMGMTSSAIFQLENLKALPLWYGICAAERLEGWSMLLKNTQTWKMPKEALRSECFIGSSAQSKGAQSIRILSANGCTFSCQVMSQLAFAGPGKAMKMQSKVLG